MVKAEKRVFGSRTDGTDETVVIGKCPYLGNACRGECKGNGGYHPHWGYGGGLEDKCSTTSGMDLRYCNIYRPPVVGSDGKITHVKEYPGGKRCLDFQKTMPLVSLHLLDSN